MQVKQGTKFILTCINSQDYNYSIVQLSRRLLEMADMMYPEYQTLDIKVNIENPEEDIKQVVQHLRPGWPQEQVVCKVKLQ